MPGVSLSFLVSSNLIFSSDGTCLFVRSADGDLWSLRVPAHPNEGKPSANDVEEGIARGIGLWQAAAERGRD
jgi:hypothetical protein